MSNFRILLFQFYKSALLWNLLISATALYAVYLGGIGNIGNSIIIKFIGYLGAFSFQYYFYPYTYFYYRNAGQSVKRLYIYSFTIDFLSYLFIVFIYSLTLHLLHVKG